MNSKYTDDITCPWCGYKFSDSWEFSGDYCEDEECPECEKEFSWSRNITVNYSSFRKKCDKCQYELGSHKLDKKPYIYKGVNYCIWKCSICNDEKILTGPAKEELYIIEIEEDS